MSEAAKKLEGDTLRSLISLVKVHTGITMEERKSELLAGRIRRRLRVLGLETAEQYIDYIQSNSTETQEFVNVVTTNETVFFRTPVVWNYFQQEFLPRWHAENPGKVLQIWSAASSSGEEACSIAMACEEFKERHLSFRYHITGTDISTDVLNVAKEGLYSGRSLEDFKVKHPVLFEKYFREENGAFKMHKHLSANMDFGIHNLHKKAPKAMHYDIVFLRNVLIYFNEPDQELVLKNIYGSLKNQGVLILGESESLSRFKIPYQFVKPLIYRRGDV